MQFVYPAFLFALAALAIPIIIHLFHFRRFKRVYFSNVRFLREVKEESQSRSRLRNLLVLLMRLLAVAFLVLLFAQPYIPQAEEVRQGPAAVSVFIDNSFSMSSLSQDVPLLDQAKRRAREIVEAFRPEDRVQILTHDFEGRHQRLVGKEAALQLIEEVRVSPVVRPLSQVVDRQQQLLRESGLENLSLYLISDFQQSIVDERNIELDTLVQSYLLPMQAVRQSNVSVDSVWFNAPVQMLGAGNTLLVKVSNRSDQTIENIRLSLTYDGQTKPVGNITLTAGAAAIDTISLLPANTGWQRARVRVTDYPVQFDDEYFFSFFVPEEIRTLVIHRDVPNPYLQSAFAGMGYFQLEESLSTNLNYTSFGRFQLIVLSDLEVVSSGLSSALQQYLEAGGNVLVFPPATADLTSYRNLLSALGGDPLLTYQALPRQVGAINTEEFVFNDVFERLDRNVRLPATQGNFQLNASGAGRGEALLDYRDGSPYLLKYRSGRGNFYLSLAPLDAEVNNLARNGEIFVPMLYKMAISGGQDEQLAYTIGRDALIELDHEASRQEQVYKISGAEGEFIPEQRVIAGRALLRVRDLPRTAGFFQVYRNEGEVNREVAFNYDRRESALQYFDVAELEDRFEGADILRVAETAVLTARVAEQSRGIQLWKWCLGLVLVFLLAEVLLLRFWKA